MAGRMRRAAIEGGGVSDQVFVVFFMDDAISIDVQRGKEGRRYLDLSRSLASTHFQAMCGKCAGEEPLLSHERVTGWTTQQEVLGYDSATGNITSTLPARKVDGLRAKLAE